MTDTMIHFAPLGITATQPPVNGHARPRRPFLEWLFFRDRVAPPPADLRTTALLDLVDRVRGVEAQSARLQAHTPSGGRREGAM